MVSFCCQGFNNNNNNAQENIASKLILFLFIDLTKNVKKKKTLNTVALCKQIGI